MPPNTGTVVAVCARGGRGGSPTAVVIDADGLDDEERRTLVRRAGTSHAAFVDTRSPEMPAVRFFTAEGELKNCGHGTLAAQAVLTRLGHAATPLRIGGRAVATTAVQRPDGIEVWFDQGQIELPTGKADTAGIVAALGAPAADLRVVSPGTPRLLVSLRDRQTLMSLQPDFARLAGECRRLGFLGCFAYALSSAADTVDARMFAPVIGVDEDIVNANSAGCLAAHLLDTRGVAAVAVHQGDALGRPSTVFARAASAGDGIAVEVGGLVTAAR